MPHCQQTPVRHALVVLLSKEGPRCGREYRHRACCRRRQDITTIRTPLTLVVVLQLPDHCALRYLVHARIRCKSAQRKPALDRNRQLHSRWIVRGSLPQAEPHRARFSPIKNPAIGCGLNVRMRSAHQFRVALASCLNGRVFRCPPAAAGNPDPQPDTSDRRRPRAKYSDDRMRLPGCCCHLQCR
jgi:hypothetical protein